jgi:hypothetical protein
VEPNHTKLGTLKIVQSSSNTVSSTYRYDYLRKKSCRSIPKFFSYPRLGTCGTGNVQSFSAY